MNRTAIAQYRNALINRSWTGSGMEPDTFAVFDANNDGVWEMAAEAVIAEGGPPENEGSLLYYHAGTGTVRKTEYGPMDGLAYVIPTESILVFERIRGKAVVTYALFKPDSSGITDITESWENSLLEDEADSIRFVEATAENIDFYLSGEGRPTGPLPHSSASRR